MTPPTLKHWLNSQHAADFFYCCLLVSTWIAMIILVDPRGEFPINDDWIYAGATQLIAEAGRFSIPGPGSPNLILQAYWGALLSKMFGFSFQVLRYSVLVVGGAGVLGLYALARDNGGSPKYSAVCGLTLACSPSYFVSSNSFMTDIPFLALSIASLFYLLRGIRLDSMGFILVGLLAAFLSIGIRQFGFCMLLTFAIIYPLNKGVRIKNIFISFLPLLMAICVQLLYQRWMVASHRAPAIIYNHDSSLRGEELLRIPMRVLFYSILVLPWVGFLNFPPLSMAARRLLRSGAAPASFRPFAILVLVATAGGLMVYLDPLLSRGVMRYLVEYGSTPLTLRDTYILGKNLPQLTAESRMIASALIVVGLAGAAIIIQILFMAARAAWRAERFGLTAPGGLNFGFALLLGGSYWAALLILLIRNGDLFERYLLFFIPVIALLGLSLGPPTDGAVKRWWTAAPTALAIVALFSFTVANTHDYFSWNRSRWTALANLLGSGAVPPSSIDGGYEFDGRYLYELNYRKRPARAWWVFNDKYMITFGPVVGYQTLHRYPVDHWLPINPSKVLVLRRAS